MPRPNPLNDPEFAQSVAEAVAAGMTRQQMCDEFGVKDKDTITRWKKHPVVKARAFKIINDRVLTVTRKVDSVIEARLQHAEAWTIKELLDVRREYATGALREQLSQADEVTVSQAEQMIENDPTLADKLDALFSGDELPGSLANEG